jgi:hypothetical protein
MAAATEINSTEVVLQDADGEAAKDVNQQDQNAGDCIATDKLGCTVHRAEELGFFANFGAAALGFFFVNESGVQICIHGHLLSGHGIQGKPCRHFGNPFGAFGDHHKVDHHQDGKHDQAHCEIATDQKMTKGLNHCAGRTGAGMSFE